MAVTSPALDAFLTIVFGISLSSKTMVKMVPAMRFGGSHGAHCCS